ncbi:helix-turn-helix domain-containing protein [Microbacterium gilvum]|uniref:Helix-turn-helix domain-containing protein n=1 Tax=Microbacterium gilvum TaxID=1336204 RepID=A0ABP9A0M1_9MICO
MSTSLTHALAEAVRSARTADGISVAALAETSGVSRAMIAKIERAEAQPTAALLAKLSGALGLTLSELIARAEADGGRVARRADQPVWTDPDSGYTRRAVSPPVAGGIELVEVELPPGVAVGFPAEAYRFLDEQIWVLAGRLRLHEGDDAVDLDAGDCVQLTSAAPCTFENAGAAPSRYVVALRKTARAF